jgi:hypothetical protein
MQRHFSSRGEAHAEAVAARMSASHRPLAKPGSGTQPRRNVPTAWQPPAAAVRRTGTTKRKEAETTGKTGFSGPEL